MESNFIRMKEQFIKSQGGMGFSVLTLPNQVAIRYFSQQMHKEFLGVSNVIKYIYGTELSAIDSEALSGYYHFDALSSTTEITDLLGTPAKMYRYDAWGNIIKGDKASHLNPFRFVGAYGVRFVEKKLNLLHMGARWYTGAIGRFISRDPVLGDEKDPLTFNRFLYIKDNPSTYIDPTGESLFVCDTRITFFGLPTPFYHVFILIVKLEASKTWGFRPKKLTPWCIISCPGRVSKQEPEDGQIRICKYVKTKACQEKCVEIVAEYYFRHPPNYSLLFYNCYHWIWTVFKECKLGLPPILPPIGVIN